MKALDTIVADVEKKAGTSIGRVKLAVMPLPSEYVPIIINLLIWIIRLQLLRLRMHCGVEATDRAVESIVQENL